MSMVESLEKLDASTRTGLLVDLFGREHMDTMLQIVEGSDELRRNLGYAARTDWVGSLGRSYDLKLDDFWSRFQLLKNEFKKLTIDVGMTGMPAMKDALEGAREITREIGEGLDHLRAEVNLDEVIAAKDAVAELAGDIAVLLDMDPDKSAIFGLFENIANLATITSGSILTIKDGLQAIGVVAADDDTDADLANRHKRLDEAFREFNPVYDTIRTFASGPGEPELSTILKADPNTKIVTQPETGDLGTSTGNAALPSSRPDPVAVAAEVQKLQDAAKEAADRATKGSLKVLPLSYPRFPPEVPIDPSSVVLPSGDAAMNMPDPDYVARRRRAAGRSPDGRSSDDGVDALREAVAAGREAEPISADLAADALRQAMEAGGQSVAQGGRDAQAAIDQGGDQLPQRGQEAGAAFSAAAGSALVGQAQAAGAAMARAFNSHVRVPSAPVGGPAAPKANRAPARTMEDAGSAGGG